jgi:hypothetical protein
MTLVTHEVVTVMRTRKYEVLGLDGVADVLRMLKREGFTGSVVINMSQGGVQREIHAEQREKLPA